MTLIALSCQIKKKISSRFNKYAVVTAQLELGMEGRALCGSGEGRCASQKPCLSGPFANNGAEAVGSWG